MPWAQQAQSVAVSVLRSWLRSVAGTGLAAAWLSCAVLAAAETVPPVAPPPPVAPELLPAPDALPVPEPPPAQDPPAAADRDPALPPLALAPPLRRPVAGLQEGPYYRTDAGAAGLLFEVSRTFEGVPLSRWALDLHSEYAWDRHPGDGGYGDWRAARAIGRYREVSLLAGYDDRRFGPARAARFQAAHLLFGGVVPQGHAKPFHDGGFGLCLWWPDAEGASGTAGQVRVIPEVGFRATLFRWPRYRASLAAFRRGAAQNNSPLYMAVEATGAAAWSFKSVEGWLYDGGVRWVVGAGRFQAAVGYRVWGIRRHVGQGPAVSVAVMF